MSRRWSALAVGWPLVAGRPLRWTEGPESGVWPERPICVAGGGVVVGGYYSDTSGKIFFHLQNRTPSGGRVIVARGPSWDPYTWVLPEPEGGWRRGTADAPGGQAERRGVCGGGRGAAAPPVEAGEAHRREPCVVDVGAAPGAPPPCQSPGQGRGEDAPRTCVQFCLDKKPSRETFRQVIFCGLLLFSLESHSDMF